MLQSHSPTADSNTRIYLFVQCITCQNLFNKLLVATNINYILKSSYNITCRLLMNDHLRQKSIKLCLLQLTCTCQGWGQSNSLLFLLFNSNSISFNSFFSIPIQFFFNSNSIYNKYNIIQFPIQFT